MAIAIPPASAAATPLLIGNVASLSVFMPRAVAPAARQHQHPLEAIFLSRAGTSPAYRTAVMAMPAMQEWCEAAEAEPDAVVELDVEF